MAYQVREVPTPFNLGGGFRDELMATAMTLSLLVVASFVMVEVLVNDGSKSDVETLTTETSSQTLGVIDESQPAVLNLVPSPSPTTILQSANEMASDSALTDRPATSAAEGDVVAPVVPFGDDGSYDYAAYSIVFSHPRLEFDASKNTKRTFVVEVTLTNKTVAEGLETKLVASIVKDGKVIVPAAALFVPNRQTVGVNQQAVFQAQINLIDGTDVRELRFEPGNDLPSTSHFLYQ